MAGFRTIYQGLRIREDILVRLKELANANGVKLSAYITGVLEAHCDGAPRVRETRGDCPSASQYVKYCGRLEMLFNALEGHLTGGLNVRSRTKFNKWVAAIGGQNSVDRTVADWDEIFKEAESHGDVYGSSAPKLSFAAEIERTANKVDWLADRKKVKSGK